MLGHGSVSQEPMIVRIVSAIRLSVRSCLWCLAKCY